MADTPFRAPELELVVRAGVSAAEYAKYKALRRKLPTRALSQLNPAIRSSTVPILDGVPFQVKFRNQGVLVEWRRLFNAQEWSRSAIRAPHWQCDHFRAQPCDADRSLRKLIFVAPILIHADPFQDRT